MTKQEQKVSPKGTTEMKIESIVYKIAGLSLQRHSSVSFNARKREG